MNAGIGALRKAGCTTIKIVVPSGHKILTDALCRRSFFVSRKKQGVFKKIGNDQVDSIIENAANWHLTMADSDEEFA